MKEAEANAKIAVAKAEGNAKAMKIKADAEAYYNKTISASLSLIKNSAGVLGIMAAAFINLPAAAGLLVWKLLLSFLSLSAELFEIKKIPGFIGVLTAAFNAVLAVMVFNAVVYVIAMAILISVKTY